MAKPPTVELPRPLASVRVVSGTPAPAGEGHARSSVGREENALKHARAQVEAQRAELAQACRAFQAAAARVAVLEQEMLRDVEPRLLDLAVEVARKVLAQEIQAGRYEIEPIVREALRNAPAEREIVVRLHPEDLAHMTDAVPADGEPLGDHVRLVADPTVRRAECLVETAVGTVEARIEDELENVRSILKEPE